MPKQHVENLNFRDVQPRPWSPSGISAGANVRVLAEDVVNGAMTGILEFPADYQVAPGLCTNAEMQLFVLEGELQMNSHTLVAGGYCYYPAQAPQPSWRCNGAVRALAIFSATPSFFSSNGRPDSTESIAAMDTWSLQWTDPLDAADPSVPFRTGVLVKILRVDPVTGASTHMAGLMPGWFSYGMETHPVYEENYCLSGDVHVAQVGSDSGYTMTEGAFLCRPPGIPHGPVLSKNGNVNLVYAHGRLGIDYVDNPRSVELVENHLHKFPWR